MNRTPLTLLAIALLLSCSHSFAQSSLQALIETVNREASTPQEHIFVRTDQAAYVVGDIIWMAVCTFDGHTSKPLDISAAAFIELVDEQGLVQVRTIVPVKQGFGEGSIKIPSHLSSGSYRLRSYTTWMKNAGPDHFFNRTLLILNPFAPSQTGVLADKPVYEVNFHTAGDSLHAGESNKIGFIIRKAGQVGAAITGTIVDQYKNTIASFRANPHGFGIFTFTPETNGHYTAVLYDSLKPIGTFELPAVASSPFSMQVRDDGIRLTWEIRPASTDRSLWLLMQAHGEVIFAQPWALSDGAVQLDKTTLAPGINRLMAFDQRGKLQGQLLYMNYPEHTLAIQVTPSAALVKPRNKVTLTITTGTSAPANLIVSVVKNCRLNNLVPSPSLPAYVHAGWALGNPPALTSVFADHNQIVLQDLSIASTYVPPYVVPDNFTLPDMDGLSWEGTVTDATGKALAGQVLFASSPSTNPRLLAARTDHTGHIRFSTYGLTGTRTLYLQNPDKQSFTFRSTNPYYQGVDRARPLPVAIDPSFQEEIIQRSISMQVNNIYHQDKWEQYAQPTDTLGFYGSSDQVYMLDQYTRFPTLEEVTREYLAKVTLRKSGKNIDFVLVNTREKRMFDKPPLTLIDGVIESRGDRILAVDARKIKRIDVVNQPFYFGEQTFSGILSFRTYKGDLDGFTPDSTLVHVQHEFVQEQRRWYAPVYADNTIDKTPDWRTVLYWNPHVTTGKDGTMTLEFFTSDLEGEFTITVEGITHDGQTGLTHQRLEVRK